MDDYHLQIAILFNDDIQVTRGEAQDLTAIQGTVTTAQSVYEALTSLGYATVKIAVRDSLEELEDILCSFSPKNTFIFNNCDGFAGNNHDAVKVVRLIERMGFSHTGAPSEAVELCIDKARAKERLIEWCVPTPMYQVFTHPKGKCSLSMPVIVKPSEEDGSIGINLDSVVCSRKKLLPRIEHVLDFYQEPVVVEEFIPGRELSVAVLGNKTLEILPISEQNYSLISDPMQWLITYEAKWDPASPYYQNITSVIPAPLTPDEERVVRQAAETSFRALGLRDFARIDMRFFNNTPYVIDINELPDLATDAGFWKSAQVSGKTYPQMIDGILKLAMEREGWHA
jgi:D-alanine-D-alanine ligase